MIKAFIAWLHRITSPAVEVEVMVGDVWVSVGSSPWSKGVSVVDVAEGWVKYETQSGTHETPIDSFREFKKLKSRA